MVRLIDRDKTSTLTIHLANMYVIYTVCLFMGKLADNSTLW